MGWIVAAAVLVGAGVVLVARGRGDDEGEKGETVGADPDSRFDYRLQYSDRGEFGRGFYLVRNSDGYVFRWQTPPGAEGLQTMQVVGEKFHEDELQSDDFAAGEPLSLVHEPEVPEGEERSSLAVMNADETLQAGYLPPDQAPSVAEKLEEGEEIECLSMWEVIKFEERVSLRLLLVGENASLDRRELSS